MPTPAPLRGIRAAIVFLTRVPVGGFPYSLALPLRGALAGAVACVVVASVCGYRFHVRAGGITGDFLGATEQVSECTLLLAFACALP